MMACGMLLFCSPNPIPSALQLTTTTSPAAASTCLACPCRSCTHCLARHLQDIITTKVTIIIISSSSSSRSKESNVQHTQQEQQQQQEDVLWSLLQLQPYQLQG
jgi:hypothetical protein